MANTYEFGSTITLRASFADLSGTLTNTEGNPDVIIYDKDCQAIDNLVSEQEGTGTYKLTYTIPTGTVQTVFFYEFKGSIAGNVALNRNKFFARFCT